MRTITRAQFDGSTAQLQARIAAFQAALTAHAATVGVPAPREEDWIEALARSGEPFEVEPPPPPPPTPEEIAARKARAALAAKRAAALAALDDARLAAAALDPAAPLEVKDYAAGLAVAAPSLDQLG